MPITNVNIVTSENHVSAGSTYYNVDTDDCQSLIIALTIDGITGSSNPYLDVSILTSDEQNEDTSGKWKIIFKFPRIYNTMYGSTGFILCHEIRNFLSKVLIKATSGGTITSTNFSIKARKVM
jgi:hypothetical protein